MVSEKPGDAVLEPDDGSDGDSRRPADEGGESGGGKRPGARRFRLGLFRMNGRRSLSSRVLAGLVALILLSAFVLWSAPRIAAVLPAWMAPVASFLAPGGTDAAALVGNLESSIQARLDALDRRLDSLEAEVRGRPDRDEVEGMARRQDAPGNGQRRLGARVEWPRESLCRLGSVPVYAADPLVRRARALQQTRDAAFAGVALNAGAAARLGLRPGESAAVCQGDARITVPVVVDDRLPEACAALPAGVPESASLGPDIGPLRIMPA